MTLKRQMNRFEGWYGILLPKVLNSGISDSLKLWKTSYLILKALTVELNCYLWRRQLRLKTWKSSSGRVVWKRVQIECSTCSIWQLWMKHNWRERECKEQSPVFRIYGNYSIQRLSEKRIEHGITCLVNKKRLIWLWRLTRRLSNK